MELLDGAVDMHVHSSPDLIPRTRDDFELARDILASGMRAALIKDHFGNSAPRAVLANRHAGREVLYGGVTLNRYAGGLNVYAVEAALRMGGKSVWMPTRQAANHYRKAAAGRIPRPERPMREAEGLGVFDGAGKLLSSVKDIISLVAEYDACLMTGHLSNAEATAVCTEALSQGVRRIVFTHPDFETNSLPVQAQADLARSGIFMEKTLISLDFGCVSAESMLNDIDRIGHEKCFVSTDYGMNGSPPSWLGMARWVELLLEYKFSEKKIHKMIKEIPWYLLGISENTAHVVA